MNTRHLLLLACGLMFFVASCDESDTDSYMPSYEGFRIEPANPRAGDTLRVTAVQRQRGKLIYHADYMWTLTYEYHREGKGDTTLVYQPATQAVVYDMASDDPVLSYAIPSGLGGRIQVGFRADFRYSGVGKGGYDGESYSSSAVAGYILPKASSSYDGCCEGMTRWIPIAANE